MVKDYNLISNFKMYIERTYEEYDNEIPTPIAVKNGKIEYDLAPARRYFYTFSSLYYKDMKIFNYNEAMLLIEFLEVLKAFANNRFKENEKYLIKNHSFIRTTKKENVKLRIALMNNDDNKQILYFDRLQCSTLVSQINKIFSKCEV